MKKILMTIRGVIVLSLLVLSFLWGAISPIVVKVFEWIMPIPYLRRKLHLLAHECVFLWIDMNWIIMKISMGKKFRIVGEGDLSPDNWYMVICNHQSWLDILLLIQVFLRKVPMFRFFMKRSLLWSLPIAGVTCWCLNFPMLYRVTKEQVKKNPKLRLKDIETTKIACNKFKIDPTTMISFVEGTRITPGKHKSQRSPFKNLLKPKTGGFATVLNEMEGYVSGIIDVTIKYSNKRMTLWKFACGDFKYIDIQYKLLPVTPDLLGDYTGDREYRKHVQEWLNVLWRKKDEEIENWKH